MKYCLVALFFFAIQSTSLAAAEPVKIGGTLGITGKYAAMSEMVAFGLKLWTKKTNENGGILGRPVELIIYDDTSDPERARKYYERLILEDHVDLVFGPYSSVITTEIVKVTEKYGFSVLASGSASDKLWQQGYRHLFGVYIPASRYSFGFLKLLFSRGIERVAIVSADDMFSRTVAEGAKTWAERLGMTVSLYAQFKKGTKNLDSLAMRIRESNAEAIVVGGHFNESVDMRMALKSTGWYPRAYFATLGPAVQKYYDLLGKDAEGTFTLSNWEAKGVMFPGSLEFARDFTEEFGRKPSYQAAAGYASGQILEAAIAKTGSLDKKALRDALASLDTLTIFGRYGVDPTGQQIRHFSLVTQWQNGTLEIVAPTGLDAVETVPAIFYPEQPPLPDIANRVDR